MSTRPCGDCGEPFADESHRCPPTTGPTSPAAVARAATPAQVEAAQQALGCWGPEITTGEWCRMHDRHSARRTERGCEHAVAVADAVVAADERLTVPVDGDRVERYRDAVAFWDATPRGDAESLGEWKVRAVMAVADAEQAALRAEVERLREGVQGARVETMDYLHGKDRDAGLDGSFAGPVALVRALINRAEAVEAEVERLRRGGRELGRIIDRQCRDVLDATGLHHLIDAEGDGDWGLVWEHLAELHPRAEAAEAALAAVEALIQKAEDRARWAPGGPGKHPAVTTKALRAILSGPSEPTCGADITHRDDDHRQSVCVLTASHASAHDDGQGCRWTDADHHGPDEPTEGEEGTPNG